MIERIKNIRILDAGYANQSGEFTEAVILSGGEALVLTKDGYTYQYLMPQHYQTVSDAQPVEEKPPTLAQSLAALIGQEMTEITVRFK